MPLLVDLVSYIKENKIFTLQLPAGSKSELFLAILITPIFTSFLFPRRRLT